MDDKPEMHPQEQWVVESIQRLAAANSIELPPYPASFSIPPDAQQQQENAREVVEGADGGGEQQPSLNLPNTEGPKPTE